MKKIPQRTCIGCNQIFPQNDLLRFVVHDKQILLSADHQGRGVYLCRKLECYQKAQKRKAFQYRLKQSIDQSSLDKLLSLFN